MLPKRLFSFSIILCLIVPCIYAQSHESAYERGLALIDEKNQTEALSVWVQAVKKNDNNVDYVDPRIGLAFIEYVTKHKLQNYYTTATLLYYAGLNGLVYSDYTDKDSKQKFYDYIEVILEKDEKEQLKRYLKDSNLAFSMKLRSYWDLNDPATSTIKNERLIEHYERIAYAKQHFTLRDDNVFHTDDRGLRYIALGPPNKKIEKTIQIYSGDMTNIMRQFNDYMSTIGKAEVTDILNDSTDFGSGDISSMKRMIDRVNTIHNFPEIEVWVYNYQNDKFDKSIYIFGKEGGSQRFKELQSLDDMIPDRAYRYARFDYSFQRLNPATIMQYLYYKDLATYDSYFAEGLYRVKQNMMKPNFDGTQSSRLIRQTNRHQLNFRQLNAPTKTSSYLEKMAILNSEVKLYRFLDKDNRTFFDAVVDVYTEPNIYFDLVYDDALKPLDYSVVSYLKMVDDNLNVTNVFKDRSNIHFFQNDSSRIVPVRNIFSVMLDPTKDLRIDSELINKEAPNNDSESIFPSHIRALGTKKIEMPDALETDEMQLVVSDMVIGTTRSDKDVKYPFVINTHDQIIKGENLTLYFEIYHLQVNDNDEHRFKLSYKIKKTGILGLKRSLDEDLQFTLNYNGKGDKAEVLLEIDMRDLSEGGYLIDFEIDEFNSNREVQVKQKFEIINPQDDISKNIDN